MITIAGSGPSVVKYGKPVTIATKKRSLPSEWVMCRFGFQYLKGGKEHLPLIIYFNKCHCHRECCPVCNPIDIEMYRMDSERWDDYWSKFKRGGNLSSQHKPSLGTCAVFGAVEMFGVDEVGLIGFDAVLDEDSTWMHDAYAEKRCIESLVNIVDLRSG